MRKFCALLIAAFTAVSFLSSANADTGSTFQFESIDTVDQMAASIRSHFPLGSSRSKLRRAFVTEGSATLRLNPHNPNVEKYIYDINLCRYYVWRWNISSDYDSNGKLLQAYVNGNAIFPDGSPKMIIPKVAAAGKKAAILKMQRPRPEADKGEASLGFLLFDRDSDLTTTGDQAAVGAGPSRADPVNMGKMTIYTEVDPWRSIFDSDKADRIVPYQGDCTKAGKRFEKEKL